MKKKNWGLFSIVLAVILGISFGMIKSPKTKVWAASSAITMSTEEDEIISGDKFIVNLVVEADETISGVEMLLTYDDEALEFVQGSPGITGAEGTLSLMNTDIANPRTKISYMLQFKAKEVGTSYIKVGKDPAIYNESSGSAMSCASNVLTVEVHSSKKQSANNNLSSLRIAGGDLTPKFSNNVSEYRVNVGSDVDQLIISAIPEDSKATVSVSGNDSLKPGKNTVKVITKAENGETRQITIDVEKEDTSELTPTLEAEDTEQEDKNPTDETEESVSESEEQETGQEDHASVVVITKEKDKLYLTTQTKLQVLECEDSALIPEGYKAASMLIDGMKVPVYKNEDETEYVLLYASKDEADPTFYVLDVAEQTVSRAHEIESNTARIQELLDQQKTLKARYNRQIQAVSIALFVVTIVALILFIILIKLHQKKKQNRSKRI